MIGIEEIDADHQDIIGTLEEIRTNLGDDTFPAVGKVKDLVQLLADHFRREEELMRQADYPKAEMHAWHHEQTMVQIQRVIAQVEESGTVGLNALRDLYKLLMDDIFPADLHFHDFLVSNNRLR